MATRCALSPTLKSVHSKEKQELAVKDERRSSWETNKPSNGLKKTIRYKRKLHNKKGKKRRHPQD